MSADQDPFGFKTPPPRRRGQPAIVIAQPGQEVRIVVPDEHGSVPGMGDNRASPSGSGDSRASPSGSGDSRASPSGSGDSRASPSASGDAFTNDAFGFRRQSRGFSPAPITIVAHAGQEIRIVVPDGDGKVSGLMGDSRASPSGSGDRH